MNIEFKMVDMNGEFEPFCECDYLNEDGVNLLASLLVDSGGEKQEETIDWLNECAVIIDKIKKGVITEDEWARDAWTALISKHEVRICSLLDDDYCQGYTLEQFEKALLGWIDYLKSDRKSAGSVIVL